MRLHSAFTGADAQTRLFDETAWPYWHGRSTSKTPTCPTSFDCPGAILPIGHQRAGLPTALRHQFAASFLGDACGGSDFLATSRPTRLATRQALGQHGVRTALVSGEVEAVYEGTQKVVDDAVLLEQRVKRISKVSKRSAQTAYTAFTVCLAMAALTFINAFVDLNNARSNRAEVEEAEEWLDDSGWPAHLDAVKEREEADGTRPSAEVVA
mmetsp:Transcript_56405/g.104394  ORF Transcript_56405/g.104394 Transcript_56405/m.104394 type:complete len:211 (+) Transcript_56405:41-673(+)